MYIGQKVRLLDNYMDPSFEKHWAGITGIIVGITKSFLLPGLQYQVEFYDTKEEKKVVRRFRNKELEKIYE